MPVLKNAKHERFAQEVAKGKAATEAYELAGYKPHESNAHRLSANDEVRARIEEILSRGAERAIVTVASILDELEEARGLALSIGQPAPAVSASMGKAKIAGFLVDKAEVTGKDGGPIETADLTDYEVARRIAFALASATPKET